MNAYLVVVPAVTREVVVDAPFLCYDETETEAFMVAAETPGQAQYEALRWLPYFSSGGFSEYPGTTAKRVAKDIQYSRGIIDDAPDEWWEWPA